jgi:bacteriocin leader peptide (microcyclamide/patellamide family)
MNTTNRKPAQTAPVARSIVGNQADLLSELSEETLVGVTASVRVIISGPDLTITCAYSGDAE